MNETRNCFRQPNHLLFGICLTGYNWKNNFADKKHHLTTGIIYNTTINNLTTINKQKQSYKCMYLYCILVIKRKTNETKELSCLPGLA